MIILHGHAGRRYLLEVFDIIRQIGEFGQFIVAVELLVPEIESAKDN